MWNLRANADVLDETWWESGGNDLWKKYARDGNIDRETNTLFLTDEEWAEFKAVAEKLPGWVGIEPYPLDNPLWVAKQNIILYICDDPLVWLQSIDINIREFYKKLWRKNKGDDRKIITEYVNECIEKVITEETSRWEMFGIVPKRIPRIHGINRVVAEWQAEYNDTFWNSMRMICIKAGNEFSDAFHLFLNQRLYALKQERDPSSTSTDTYSPWEWLQNGLEDNDKDDDEDDWEEEKYDDYDD